MTEIKNMIDIDFQENDIARLPQRMINPKIIKLKNGHNSFWENTNPNNLIMEYLKANSKKGFIKRHNILYPIDSIGKIDSRE